MSKELIIKGKTISSERAMVCVPIVASTRESILEKVKNSIDAGVSMIEIRGDYFDFIDDRHMLYDVLNDIKSMTGDVIVLFTIRTENEGGEISLTPEEYKDILLFTSASECVDIIDVEVDSVEDPKHFISVLQNNGVYVVASHHDFECTPVLIDLVEMYDNMHDSGADILKLACMPYNSEDALRILKAGAIANKTYQENLVVAISMGQYGKMTRVVGSQVGSCITFAALENQSAPGQIGYHELVSILDTLKF